MSIDRESNPEQEAAARDGLIKVFRETTRFSHNRGEVTPLVSQDGSKEILLVAEDGSGDGYVKFEGEEGQEKWYITNQNGPRNRVSTSATGGVMGENPHTGKLELKELGETASVEKMEELTALIQNGQQSERTTRSAVESVEGKPAGEALVTEINGYLPPDSEAPMAVVETVDGRVLLARGSQGGVTLASESGEVYSVSSDGKVANTIPDAAAILSGGQATPDTSRVSELVTILEQGHLVELPEDPQEMLAFLQSLELNPQIDFSRRNGQS